MHDILKHISGKERRGGDSFASLLFVVAAFVFSATSFALTDELMGSRDTTMSFVPMSATTYVHSNGRAATEALLSAFAEMPPDLHPYELAMFTAPGDDAPQHGAILAWGRFTIPSGAEIAILNERGATRLDDRHYFLGDSSLATAAKVASAAHVSLANNVLRRDALAATRSLFSLQLMTNPRDIAVDVGAPALDKALTEITPEMAVVGFSLSQHSFMARVTPLSVPLASRLDRGVVAGLHPNRVAASAVIIEPSPDFNIAKLFAFDASNDVGVTKDTLAESDGALRSALSSPFELWIKKSDDTRPSPLFLFHFPLISSKDAAQAVSRSFSVRNPTAQNLNLPDGDVASEMVVANMMTSNEAVTGDLTFGNEAGKVVVGSDGAKGSLIGSNKDIITEFRHPMASHNAAQDPCGTFSETLIINDIAAIKEKNPLLRVLVDRTGINTFSFSRSVGNEVLICGYKK